MHATDDEQAGAGRNSLFGENGVWVKRGGGLAGWHSSEPVEELPAGLEVIAGYLSRNDAVESLELRDEAIECTVKGRSSPFGFALDSGLSTLDCMVTA